ncbi:MAG TPA: S41 family peptidase, partial [Gemmatimonadales bacterium]|nr:S41 family peptidase [Gemmatimonadales bacterium]
RRTNPSHLPFRFRLFDRRMFVDTAAAGTGLARGDEVEAIDGRPVALLLDSLAPLVAIDGFTEHVRLAKLEADGDLYGTDFDTYHPALFGLRDSLALRVRPHGSATPVERVVPAISFDAWKALAPGTWRLDFGTATSLAFLDDTTARLSIPTFVNYRTPVDERRFLRAIFDSIQARGVRHLILDIGGGGSTEPVDELLRHLMPSPFVLTREARVRQRRVPEDLLPHVTTWNREALDPPARAIAPADSGWWRLTEYDRDRRRPLVPYEDRYRGAVTILTGPGNASGATMLIARMRDAGRVRLVGDSTGGSAEGPTAGTLLTLTLPASRIRVRIPLVRSYTDIRRFTPGYGVAPDVFVRPSVDDWIAGRDPVLAAALGQH